MDESPVAKDHQILENLFFSVMKLAIAFSESKNSKVGMFGLVVTRRVAIPLLQALEAVSERDKKIKRAVYSADNIWLSLRKRIDESYYAGSKMEIPTTILVKFIKVRFQLYEAQYKFLSDVSMNEAIEFFESRKLAEVEQIRLLDQT